MKTIHLSACLHAAGQPATNTLNDIQKSAEELKKSLKGLGDVLQGIFK